MEYEKFTLNYGTWQDLPLPSLQPLITKLYETLKLKPHLQAISFLSCAKLVPKQVTYEMRCVNPAQV